MFKIVLATFIIICIIGTVILGFLGNYLYNYALNSNAKKTIFSSSEKKLETSGEIKEPDQAWLLKKAKDITLNSKDGLLLHAYEINNKSDIYVIAVHGYRSEGLGMASYAKHFNNIGYNVLVPDLRGHGKSEGNNVGMGWPDRLDLLEWINVILKEKKNAKVILMGVSMGAATVMMASGEKLPSQVKCIIEDCGYTSVWDEFKLQLKNEFHLPAFPVLNAASVVTRLRAGYDFTEADAAKQVRKSKTPILFIHGDSDTFVPYSMLEPLYNAAKCAKMKVVIKGAEHAKSSVIDPNTYWNAVEHWVVKYTNQ
nr:alpha/beta fold hydrolase [Anaeromicropila herbilytica]